MNYLILSAIVIGVSILYERLRTEYKLSNGAKVFFYALICFILCLFAGLRTEYNDTIVYIWGYERTPDSFFSIFSGEFSVSKVYLFKVWNYIIYHFVSPNVNVYFFMSAIILVCPAIYLIDRYSKNFTISIILFMFGGMYLFSLAGLKQAMATGVILMGVPALIKKQYIRYYICAVLALGFHTYSLFFLVVPLLGVEIFNKRTIVFCLTIIIAGVLISYVSSIITALIEMLGKDVSEETIQSGSVNIFRAAVFIVPFILTIISRKNLDDATDAEKILIKMGLLSSAFMILSLFGNPIFFGRIPQYFLIGTVVTLPLLIEKAFENKDRPLIALFAILGYTLFGIYGLYIDGAFSQDIFGLIIF